MMPSSNTYDVEIGVTIRAETSEKAWETIYRAAHDILESMLESGQITDWTVDEPKLARDYSEDLQSP